VNQKIFSEDLFHQADYDHKEESEKSTFKVFGLSHISGPSKKDHNFSSLEGIMIMV
jgi:hypothetical protein